MCSGRFGPKATPDQINGHLQATPFILSKTPPLSSKAQLIGHIAGSVASMDFSNRCQKTTDTFKQTPARDTDKPYVSFFAGRHYFSRPKHKLFLSVPQEWKIGRE